MPVCRYDTTRQRFETTVARNCSRLRSDLRRELAAEGAGAIAQRGQRASRVGPARLLRSDETAVRIDGLRDARRALLLRPLELRAQCDREAREARSIFSCISAFALRRRAGITRKPSAATTLAMRMPVTSAAAVDAAMVTSVPRPSAAPPAAAAVVTAARRDPQWPPLRVACRTSRSPAALRRPTMSGSI